MAEIRSILEMCDLRPQDYLGHSFGIGAATTAAACCIPAEMIMTLNHWKIQAYRLYIRLPREQLEGMSQALAASILKPSIG